MKLERVLLKDKVVKKILTSEKKECREYLLRIISASTKIDIELLRDNIELITNDIGINKELVNTTVDMIYKGEKEYFNIEINYNKSHIVTVKNNIYLYNMILRQVGREKEDYIKQKYEEIYKKQDININNYDYYGIGEFIYEAEMIEKKHNIVRDKMIKVIDINLSYLDKIDYNETVNTLMELSNLAGGV